MKKTFRNISTILVTILFACSIQAQTSENNVRLKDALKRYPEADANKDGVLTKEEGLAYKTQLEADKPSATIANEGEIKSTYVYKTVGNHELKLFVDAPKGHSAKAKVPAIVLFHGGGFRSGSEKQFEKQAAYLAERGMVAIRGLYRLTTQQGVTIEDCIEDGISVMRWVRANAEKLGVDPDRIAAGGGSAGGYLSAASLLLDSVRAKTDPPGVSAKPNALVLFNPAFGKADDGKAVDPRDPDGKGELIQYVKPDAKLPPMINFFGTEDPFLSVAQKFQAAYTKGGNRCEIVTYEGEGHSFFNKEKYYKLTIAEADKFLVGLGWLEKAAGSP